MVTAQTLVYVAGRYRASTTWKIRQNVLDAENAALLVIEMGAFPVIPHKMAENFHGISTEQYWLEGTLELMRRCDAVYVFEPKDYERSQGTKGEVDEARRMGKPVLFGSHQLYEWLIEKQAACG